MRLIKFVKKEFNILDGFQSIRIGTLKYYRELEGHDEISDSKEGVSEHSTDTAQTFTYKNSEKNPVSKLFQLDEKSSITFERVTLRTNHPNILIFCCTFVADITTDEQLNEKAKLLGYNSWYEIKNPIEFSELCAKRISETITLKQISNLDINKLSLSNLQFMIHKPHRIVEYKDNIKPLNDSSNYIEDFSNDIFTKDKKFSRDDEYRFAFILEHTKMGICNIADDFIDISTNIYDSFIS